MELVSINASLIDFPLPHKIPRDLASANLPEFVNPALLITIQPVGVSYTNPVPIIFPNVDNLDPSLIDYIF